MNNKKLMINFYSLFFLKTIGQFRMIVVRRQVLNTTVFGHQAGRICKAKARPASGTKAKILSRKW